MSHPDGASGAGPRRRKSRRNVSYGLARMLPTSVVSRLAAAFGGLMVLGGAWMFLLGCTRFLPSKRKPAR